MVYIHRTLIVPADKQAFAQTLCEALAGEAGAGMFLMGLSATGELPASHFISAGMIEDTFAYLLPLTSFDAEGTPATAPGQPETIVTLADGAVTLEQVNALLAAVDVTEQEAFVAMARLGLQMIQGAP